MPKNLNFCFKKFKSLPSLQENHRRPFCNPAAASLLIKNFNSLYDFTIDCSAAATTSVASSTTSDHHSLSDSESETETTKTADLATAFASQRFFFSSPGLSNSIVDSTSAASSSLASTSTSSPESPPESDTIAVPTYSVDPFIDFRRSMQEMVEARELIDIKSDWDYLHELLMRYLSLNPKSTHKFIVGAFADLLVSMMTPPPPESGHRKKGKCM